MYIHKDFDGIVSNEFFNGLEIFMYKTGSTPITHETSKMPCYCWKCKNTKFISSEIVRNHLVDINFTL